MFKSFLVELPLLLLNSFSMTILLVILGFDALLHVDQVLPLLTHQLLVLFVVVEEPLLF